MSEEKLQTLIKPNSATRAQRSIIPDLASTRKIAVLRRDHSIRNALTTASDLNAAAFAIEAENPQNRLDWGRRA